MKISLSIIAVAILADLLCGCKTITYTSADGSSLTIKSFLMDETVGTITGSATTAATTTRPATTVAVSIENLSESQQLSAVIAQLAQAVVSQTSTPTIAALAAKAPGK